MIRLHVRLYEVPPLNRDSEIATRHDKYDEEQPRTSRDAIHCEFIDAKPDFGKQLSATHRRLARSVT